MIEDLPELRDTRIRIRVPHRVKRLRLEPAEMDLAMKEIAPGGDATPAAGAAPGGWRVVETLVPAFSCHAAVVAEY